MNIKGETFGERVAHALDLRGWKAADLAREMGRKPAIVSHWITGARNCPLTAQREIAEILKVSAAWLSKGEGNLNTASLGEFPDRPAGTGQTGDWYFRPAPPDGGRDFGNANTYATPPNVGTLVREIGQNSMDAADRGATPAPVVMRYSLIELTRGGKGWSAFLTAVQFSKLQVHIEHAADENSARSKLAAKLRDGLSSFTHDSKIVLLRIDDYGTVGLYGPEPNEQGANEERSSPYTALVRNNLDSSKDAATAGGAYGLGKAVLWNCSAISTVLFSSNVPRENRGTRVTGRTELTWHRVGESDFAGPGWFGEPEIGGSIWETDSALLKAMCLDRDSRLPAGLDVQHSFGTSALVIGFRDPESEGYEDTSELLENLARSAAENFFPAIIDRKLRVIVEHVVDDVVREQREVSPQVYVPEFCAALAAHNDDEVVETFGDAAQTIRRVIPQRVPGTRPENSDVEHHPEMEAKALLLVRTDDDVNEGSHTRLTNTVALVRGRGMVVKFWNREGIAMGAKPFHAIVIAGDGVSNDTAQRAAEQFLRLSEPPAHDTWEYRPELKVAFRPGAKQRLTDFFGAITNELRNIVQPQSQGSDDGPEELKRLLQFGASGPPIPPKATLRDVRSKIVDGRWSIEGRIHINDRDSRLHLIPRAWIDVESGAAIRLPWQQLSFLYGQVEFSTDVGGVTVGPRSRAITVRALTDAAVDGIRADQCRARIDLVATNVETEGGR